MARWGVCLRRMGRTESCLRAFPWNGSRGNDDESGGCGEPPEAGGVVFIHVIGRRRSILAASWFGPRAWRDADGAGSRWNAARFGQEHLVSRARGVDARDALQHR